MNQEILEKRVKELIVFFEKHPKESKAMSILEYKNILKGLILLISKSSNNIDFTAVYSYFNIKNVVSNNQLIDIIEALIIKCKTPEYIEYTGILKILKTYEICLNQSNIIVLSIDEWIDLSGKTRVLELERLWFNVKK